MTTPKRRSILFSHVYVIPVKPKVPFAAKIIRNKVEWIAPSADSTQRHGTSTDNVNMSCACYLHPFPHKRRKWRTLTTPQKFIQFSSKQEEVLFDRNESMASALKVTYVAGEFH